ncbi:hypothetical protein RRG08_026584 [Elysia crispata]|uniref:Uncharacterized protein n=1 Tax=Elysia crispata TaxID=231223 RepID=A0AAE0Y3X9_9GAST|nr:hypothetical protein RRG08_026584 [Elysia crispata]
MALMLVDLALSRISRFVTFSCYRMSRIDLRLRVWKRSSSLMCLRHRSTSHTRKGGCSVFFIVMDGVMELADQVYKFPEAAKSLENYPQRFSVDGVRSMKTACYLHFYCI